MTFKVGEYVVHAAHGVGQIKRLEEKQFPGSDMQWYYVVTTPTSTVWAPVQLPSVAGLRALTTKSKLKRYRAILKSAPAPLKAERHQRQMELNERLKDGSFATLCEVVRDLTALSWRKPLGESDNLILRRARESLSHEWSVACGISIAEANKEVDALLLDGRRAAGG